MDIGIPVERSSSERRVALTPAGVERLVRRGNRVFVERWAGQGASFTDDEFVEAGAQLSYSAEEVYGRADLLLKVLSPTPDEIALLPSGKMLMCFLQPGVMPRQGFQDLLERKIFGVAMELIEDRPGNAPILRAMSEIAGPMAIQTAAHLLLSSSGGRGVLLGGAPGIPPAVVVILGAGAVGTTAARAALGNGAQVVVLDRDLERLRRIDERHGPSVTTMFADARNVGRASAFADVMIGAAAIRGDRTPMVVTEDMVQKMRPGSVILDLSIDQGGCVEGIRPTSIAEPTYIRHDVVHYAVANMPANVARTATYALTNVILPYVREIAGRGLEAACAADHGLRRGFVTASGKCLRPRLAERFGVRYADVTGLVSEDWTTA